MRPDEQAAFAKMKSFRASILKTLALMQSLSLQGESLVLPLHILQSRRHRKKRLRQKPLFCVPWESRPRLSRLTIRLWRS
jgi:hypothetical protein